MYVLSVCSHRWQLPLVALCLVIDPMALDDRIRFSHLHRALQAYAVPVVPLPLCDTVGDDSGDGGHGRSPQQQPSPPPGVGDIISHWLQQCATHALVLDETPAAVSVWMGCSPERVVPTLVSRRPACSVLTAVTPM